MTARCTEPPGRASRCTWARLTGRTRLPPRKKRLERIMPSNHTGTRTPAHSAATIVRLASAIDGPSGRFFDATGEVGW